MSNQNISRFFEKLSTDTELQQQVATIDAEAKRLVADRLSALSVEHELPFTSEELLAAGSSSSGELPDSDLAKVSGGSIIEDFQRTFSGLFNMFPGLDPKRSRK